MNEKITKRLWAALFFIAALFEVWGIRRRQRGDTLSEYTWSKTKTPVMRGAVTALVAWLVYHFSYGNGVPLSAWDAVFAGIGAVLGVASTMKKTSITGGK